MRITAFYLLPQPKSFLPLKHGAFVDEVRDKLARAYAWELTYWRNWARRRLPEAPK